MTAVVTLKPGQTGRHYQLPTGVDYKTVYKVQARVDQILEEWDRGEVDLLSLLLQLLRIPFLRSVCLRPQLQHLYPSQWSREGSLQTAS